MLRRLSLSPPPSAVHSRQSEGDTFGGSVIAPSPLHPPPPGTDQDTTCTERPGSPIPERGHMETGERAEPERNPLPGCPGRPTLSDEGVAINVVLDRGGRQNGIGNSSHRRISRTMRQPAVSASSVVSFRH